MRPLSARHRFEINDINCASHLKSTKALILGRAKGIQLSLKLCGHPVEQTEVNTFNGFRVSTTTGAWDSRPHISTKLVTSRKDSNCILALRRKILTATPIQNIHLWRTFIEPHLTYSSEVIFDCHKSALKSMA